MQCLPGMDRITYRILPGTRARTFTVVASDGTSMQGFRSQTQAAGAAVARGWLTPGQVAL